METSVITLMITGIYGSGHPWILTIQKASMKLLLSHWCMLLYLITSLKEERPPFCLKVLTYWIRIMVLHRWVTLIIWPKLPVIPLVDWWCWHLDIDLINWALGVDEKQIHLIIYPSGWKKGSTILFCFLYEIRSQIVMLFVLRGSEKKGKLRVEHLIK